MARFLIAAALVVGASAGSLDRLSAQADADRQISLARSAAGDDHVRALSYLCGLEPASRGSAAPPAPQGMPDWYAYPVRVFDNLYFVGTRSLNSWAVTTSQGIVVIDPAYDYSVDLAVIRGLELLGLDPESITHVIVNHGHGDHYGGARRLQQTFGAQVVMGAADWTMMENDRGDQPKPDRDVVLEADQELVVGDTRFTILATPGHTPGGTSLLFPVRDGDRTHVVSMWGGTSILGFGEDRARHRQYMGSADRFAEATRGAGGDVVLSNHDIFDEVHRKVAALRDRAGGPHPFVVGEEVAVGFVEMARSCTAASLARLDP
jgi:metallo-beta-lactamase class B